MARRPIITKLETLQEDLKIARHCVNDRRLKATPQWLEARIAEQNTIIATAQAKVAELRVTHEKAASELATYEADLKNKEAALHKYLNRGAIERKANEANDAIERMKELIEKLRLSGVSEDKIKEALGGIL